MLSFQLFEINCFNLHWESGGDHFLPFVEALPLRYCSRNERKTAEHFKYFTTALGYIAFLAPGQEQTLNIKTMALIPPLHFTNVHWLQLSESHGTDCVSGVISRVLVINYFVNTGLFKVMFRSRRRAALINHWETFLDSSTENIKT